MWERRAAYPFSGRAANLSKRNDDRANGRRFLANRLSSSKESAFVSTLAEDPTPTPSPGPIRKRERPSDQHDLENPLVLEYRGVCDRPIR